MAVSQIEPIIKHLRTVALRQDGAGVTDGQLLETFVTTQDAGAFEALVRRHGPMVWGACHRLLRNQHDAEDAFQATFLVLARKAASVSPREMVGNWLYGVAHTVALRAQVATAKQRVRERQVMHMPEPAPVNQGIPEDLQTLLDQELRRLPDKYRTAIVLCDLEGRTRREVARQFKIPEGTLSSRLTTGRRMLATRLTRHGLVLSGGTVATIMSQNAASACVPASLVATTVKAATLVAAGQAVATAGVSTAVAALIEGAMKTMFLTKLKIATAIALMAIVLMAGSGVLCRATSTAAEPQADSVAHGSGENEPGSPGKKQNQLASGATGSEAEVPLYELHVQVLIGVTEQKKFSMALPMNVSGQVRIIEGGVVPDAFNREQLGIFLRAKVVGENVRGMLTELALDDIGLVDGKADIKRLYSGKQFGKAQGFSFDSKALPGPPRNPRIPRRRRMRLNRFQIPCKRSSPSLTMLIPPTTCGSCWG